MPERMLLSSNAICVFLCRKKRRRRRRRRRLPFLPPKGEEEVEEEEQQQLLLLLLLLLLLSPTFEQLATHCPDDAGYQRFTQLTPVSLWICFIVSQWCDLESLGPVHKKLNVVS